MLSWTPGALTQTDYASSTASATTYVDNLYAGIGSVTITISGDTSFLASGSPAIANSLQSGFGGTEKPLRFDVNFTSDTQSIIVTVTFNNYVHGVDQTHFSLFDVDAGNGSNFDDAVDQVRKIMADSVQPAEVIGSSKNVVSNNWTTSATATGTGPAGNTSGNGNVDIDFKIYEPVMHFVLELSVHCKYNWALRLGWRMHAQDIRVMSATRSGNSALPI